ncbi:MAG: septum formation initiator family protein [Patescibacteria group bacterium]
MQHKPSLIRKIFSSRAIFAAGLFLLVVLVVAYLRAYYQNYQIQAEIRSMLDESAKLENKNAELRALLARVKRSDYVEEKARTELGLMKEGEKETIIIGSNTEKGSRQTETGMLESNRSSNPRQWWNYFFNHK